MKRLPTRAEVSAFLAANASHYDDGRWGVPSVSGGFTPVFEPAALKLAEVHLIVGTPLLDTVTSDFALILARRLVALEQAVAECRAPVSAPEPGVVPV